MGVLSPYLFALYVDNVIGKTARTDIGYFIHLFCSNIVMYTDDILLLAPSADALQKILDTCEEKLKT